MLPVSYVFGVVLGFGITAIFIGLLGNLFIPVFINLFRFNTGKWKGMSRRIRGVE